VHDLGTGGIIPLIGACGIAGLVYTLL